jgi:hypothetical protein
MKHPPVTQGLDQASHLPAEAWEQFFMLCLEWAEVARKRRAEQQQNGGNVTEPDGQRQTAGTTCLPLPGGTALIEEK